MYADKEPNCIVNRIIVYFIVEVIVKNHKGDRTFVKFLRERTLNNESGVVLIVENRNEEKDEKVPTNYFYAQTNQPKNQPKVTVLRLQFNQGKMRYFLRLNNV